MTAAPLRLRSINSPLMSESCTGMDVVGVRSALRRSRPLAMNRIIGGCALRVASCATRNSQLATMPSRRRDRHPIAARQLQELCRARVGHGDLDAAARPDDE